MAAQYKIIIQQGSTYDQTFLFKNKLTNTPIDFTGYSARMQLRTSYDAAAASISLDEGSGMTTGAHVLGTIANADLPASTTFLAWRAYLNNGGTAAAVNYDVMRAYIETDY